MIKLENVELGTGRAAAVVGDTLADVVGKPLGSYPILAFNVIVQPSGSDIFSGLGTAGADVPFTSLGSATFSASGFHSFTAAGANGEIVKFDVVCFGTNALTVPQIKYQDQGRSQLRTAKEARGILRALALHATKPGAQAPHESSAPAAPYWGTKPRTLGAANNNSADAP